MSALKKNQPIDILLVEDSPSDADGALENRAASKFFNKVAQEWKIGCQQ